MKAKWKLRLKTNDGRRVEVVLRYDTGLLHLDVWDGEQTAYMSYMTMQNGQIDLGVMSVNIDCPIVCKTYSGRSAVGKSWHVVLEGLVESAIANLFKHEGTPADPSLTERSARIINNRILKLLLEDFLDE